MIIELLTQELELFFSDPEPTAETLSITLTYHHSPFTSPLIPDKGIYWNNGSDRTRRIALGSAWSAEFEGESRFSLIQNQFAALQAGWVHLDPEESDHSPSLYLQYAFSADDPMDGEWEGIPNTLLRLPRLQLINRQGYQLITLSHRLEGSRQEEILDHWRGDLEHLGQLLKNPSIPSTVEYTPLKTPSNQTERLEQAIEVIQKSSIEKIVLGQRYPFRFNHPLSLQQPLQQMEKRAPQGIQLLFATGGKELVAFPPEQLIKKVEKQITAEALAGTVPRGKNPTEEQQFGQQLINNQKLRHEHHLVAHFIHQQLQRFCNSIECPAEPTVHKLENIQHLLTTLQGELIHPTPLLELVEALHQSPAICGSPKTASLQWLQQHHNSHRGAYCGGAGWINRDGDGEVYVLLRCSMVEGSMATLYAGAGVIAESTAADEQAEIHLKIQGIMNVLSPQ